MIKSLTKISFVLAFVILSVTWARPASAALPGDGRFGLGVVLGEPTAITGKYWTSSDNAIDFGLSFAPSYSALVYGDYHWYWPAGFGHRSRFVGDLNPYVGIGGGIFFWNGGYYYGDRPWGWRDYNQGTGVYVRVPLGIEWFPGRPPLGVFVEIDPSVAIIPGAWLFFDVGVGIRFYF